ncbi:MAG: IS1595 family transposase [Bacteroidales bacterium]
MSEQQKVMLELKKIQKGYNVTLKREDMLCPHCGSGAIIKHSKYKDTQRFKCKECNRTFLPTTGTYIHNIKKKGKFIEYCEIVKAEGLHTIKYMSERLGISVPTAFDWRHKILLSIPENKDKFDVETQADDLWFLYSQKGRKGLKYSRQRGGINRRGDNDFQVKVITASDKKQVVMKVAKIGRIDQSDIIAAIGDKFNKNDTLVTDSHPSYSAFAKILGLKHVKFISKNHKAETGENVQYINNLANRLKTLINHNLKGVATKYLPLYTSYFAYIEKNILNVLDNRFTSNTKVWDMFTNIEKMYEQFIKTKSARTYRCPIKRSWKSQFWNFKIVNTSNIFLT